MTTSHLDQMSEKGFCVLEQAIPEGQVRHLLEKVKSLYESTKDNISQDVPFLNNGQPNVYNLQNKDVELVRFLFELKEVEAILLPCMNDKWYKQIPQDQPNYILRSFGARSSQAALPLHIDSFIPYKGDELIAVQVVVVLEDMTLENGCTLVIPGSHQSCEYADNEAKNKAIPLTLKAGDIAIWDSRLWHGTMENTTDSTRWAMIATFTRWWVKQHFDIPKALPDDIYQALSPKHRSLLGFCSMPWPSEYEGIELKRSYDDVAD